MAKAAAVKKDEDPRDRLERMRALARDLIAEKAARLIEADGREATDWQEGHSPTEAVLVRVSDKRQKEQSRRRKQDARLFDAIEAAGLERPAIWVIRGFEALTGPVSVRIASLEARVSGRGDREERMARAAMLRAEEIGAIAKMKDAYVSWGAECTRRGISHAAIVDVLCFGKTPNQVDKDRRKWNGWAKDNMMRGLQLFAVMRGWAREAK